MSISRREVVAGLAVLLAGGSHPASSQPTPKRRLGLLIPFGDPEAFLDEGRARLIAALTRLGYVPGRTLEIVQRHTGDQDRLGELAAQLVSLNVDAIVTEGTAATRAVRRASHSIPIVTTVGDPIAAGFASELRRPGGNVTGISQSRTRLRVVQFELLRSMFPGIRTIVLLVDETHPARNKETRRVVVPGASSITAHVMPFRGREYGAPLRECRERGIKAGLVTLGPSKERTVQEVAHAAIKEGIALVADYSAFARVGFIASVMNDGYNDVQELAAVLDKIFRGANPAEIPFSESTRFETVLNKKTAAALGVRFSPDLLLRADHVIE